MNWQTLTNIGLVIGLLSSLITIGDKVLSRPAGKPAPAQANSPVNIWHVEERHIFMMIGGALLYAVMSTIIADHYASARIGAVSLTSLTSALTLFAGVVGGPWVGLFVGAVGYTLTGVPHLTQPGISFPFPPAYAVGDGIAGLIGGLTLIVTHGKFSSWRSLLLVEIMSAIGLITGDFCSSAIFHAQVGRSAPPLATGLQSDIICTLVLLPIALLLFSKQTK